MAPAPGRRPCPACGKPLLPSRWGTVPWHYESDGGPAAGCAGTGQRFEHEHDLVTTGPRIRAGSVAVECVTCDFEGFHLGA